MKNSYSCFYLKKLQRKTYLKNFINVLKKNNTPSKKQHSPSRLKKKNNVQNIQSFFYLHSAKHRRFQRTGFQIRKNFFSFDLPSVHRINLSVLSKKIKNFFHVSQSTCLPFKTWKNTVKNKNIFEISRININNFLNLQNAEFEKIFMTNIYPQQREVFSIAKVNQKNFLFLCPGGQKRNFFFCTHSTLVQKHSVEWVFFSTVTLKKKLFVFMSGGQKLFFLKKKSKGKKLLVSQRKTQPLLFFLAKKKNKKKITNAAKKKQDPFPRWKINCLNHQILIKRRIKNIINDLKKVRIIQNKKKEKENRVALIGRGRSHNFKLDFHQVDLRLRLLKLLMKRESSTIGVEADQINFEIEDFQGVIGNLCPNLHLTLCLLKFEIGLKSALELNFNIIPIKQSLWLNSFKCQNKKFKKNFSKKKNNIAKAVFNNFLKNSQHIYMKKNFKEIFNQKMNYENLLMPAFLNKKKEYNDLFQKKDLKNRKNPVFSDLIFSKKKYKFLFVQFFLEIHCCIFLNLKNLQKDDISGNNSYENKFLRKNQYACDTHFNQNRWVAGHNSNQQKVLVRMQELGSPSMLHKRNCEATQHNLLMSSSAGLAPALWAGAPNLHQCRAEYNTISKYKTKKSKIFKNQATSKVLFLLFCNINRYESAYQNKPLHTKNFFYLNHKKYINFNLQYTKTMSYCVFVFCKKKIFQKTFDIFLKTLDIDFSNLLFQTPLNFWSEKKKLVSSKLGSIQTNKKKNHTAIEKKEKAILYKKKKQRFNFFYFQKLPTQFQNSFSPEKDKKILLFNFLKLYNSTQKTFKIFFENFFSINYLSPVFFIKPGNNCDYDFWGKKKRNKKKLSQKKHTNFFKNHNDFLIIFSQISKFPISMFQAKIEKTKNFVQIFEMPSFFCLSVANKNFFSLFFLNSNKTYKENFPMFLLKQKYTQVKSWQRFNKIFLTPVEIHCGRSQTKNFQHQPNSDFCLIDCSLKEKQCNFHLPVETSPQTFVCEKKHTNFQPFFQIDNKHLLNKTNFFVTQSAKKKYLSNLFRKNSRHQKLSCDFSCSGYQRSCFFFSHLPYTSAKHSVEWCEKKKTSSFLPLLFSFKKKSCFCPPDIKTKNFSSNILYIHLEKNFFHLSCMFVASCSIERASLVFRPKKWLFLIQKSYFYEHFFWITETSQTHRFAFVPYVSSSEVALNLHSTPSSKLLPQHKKFLLLESLLNSENPNHLTARQFSSKFKPIAQHPKMQDDCLSTHFKLNSINHKPNFCSLKTHFFGSGCQLPWLTSSFLAEDLLFFLKKKSRFCHPDIKTKSFFQKPKTKKEATLHFGLKKIFQFIKFQNKFNRIFDFNVFFEGFCFENKYLKFFLLNPIYLLSLNYHGNFLVNQEFLNLNLVFFLNNLSFFEKFGVFFEDIFIFKEFVFSTMWTKSFLKAPNKKFLCTPFFSIQTTQLCIQNFEANCFLSFDGRGKSPKLPLSLCVKKNTKRIFQKNVKPEKQEKTSHKKLSFSHLFKSQNLLFSRKQLSLLKIVKFINVFWLLSKNFCVLPTKIGTVSLFYASPLFCIYSIVQSQNLLFLQSWYKQKNQKHFPRFETKSPTLNFDEFHFFLSYNSQKNLKKIFFFNKKPTLESIKTHLKECKQILRNSIGKKQLSFMKKLQKKIQVWCTKYNTVSSKEIFHYCDSVLLKYLWNWAQRTHPSKSKFWIRKKYFHFIHSKKWFFGKKIGKNFICLPLHSQIKI